METEEATDRQALLITMSRSAETASTLERAAAASLPAMSLFLLSHQVFFTKYS